MKKFLLSLICLFAVIPFVQADTISSNFTDKNLTVGTGELTWTASPAAGSFENSGSNRGVAWSKPGTLTLTSGSELPANATISQIDVVCSSNVASAYTLSAEVGGAAFGTAVTLAKENNVTQTFEGSAVGSIQLKAVGTSSAKSIWIKSITVTYTTGGGPVVQTVATPEITPGTCNFTEAFKATVTCATSGASIYYSLDGSDPATLYSGAITIPAGANVTLKAKATKADYNDSAVASAVYTYVEPAPEGAKYQLVDISELAASDIVVIYDANSEKAMSSSSGSSSSPLAVSVGHNDDFTELTYADVTDDLKWNIVSTSDGYVIYPNGITDSWLCYTSNAISGNNTSLRVSTNDSKNFDVYVPSSGTGQGQTYLRVNTGSIYRYIGVYNTDWRGYTSVNNNIASQNTKFYRYVANAGEQVEAPVISPNGGSDLIEAQTVTLSCETEDASIYYTLDGSNPTAESTLYSAPFQVSETTTVKAIAIKEGLSNSSVASATFQFRVAASSIADFYTKAEGGNIVYINFPMTVTAATAAEGKTFYVTDGTSYSSIYCGTANALSYGIGNVIPAGWNATLSDYHNLKEIVPSDAASMPQASSTVEVNYPVLRGTDIVAENQSMPGTLKNFELPEDMPARATNINVTYDDASFVLRNSFLIDAVSAGTYDVTGVIIVYGTTVQFLPLEFVEVIPEPVPDVYILGNVNGNSWSPSQGVQMTYNADGEMYTATITVASGGGSFSFATALGEGDDWDTLNGRDVRWGHGGSDYTLSAEDMQGQNAIACSKYDWTTGSYVVPEGEYNLTLSFDGDGLNAYLFVEKVETAKDVYILGTVNGGAFAPNSGIQMEYDEELGVYVAEVYATSGAMINFAHNLAESWEALNVAGNRFGPDDTANYNVNDTDLEIPAEYSTDPHSFVLAAGKWEVVVNLDNEGYKTVDFTKLTFAAPTFSEESKEFHAAFDLTITGPEGSTITYVLNDDIDNAVTTQSNVAVVNIPAEDTSVLAWATMYGVDSESNEEDYIYSEAIVVPAGQYWKVTASDQPLEAGKYLIVCEAVELNAAAGSPLREATVVSNPVFNGGAETLDAVSNNVATSRTGDEIQLDSESDTYYFNIAPVDGKDDTYTIQAANGLYIGNSSTSKNQIETSESPLENTITIDNDGNAIIAGEGGKVIRYNSTSGQNRFRYMNSTSSNPVQLYFNGQTVTGVDKVAASDSEVVSTAYYNLQGVRLAAPAQGQVAIRVSTLANGQIRASKVVVR